MTQRVPYVRPLELGSSSETYTLRVVQDGTNTVAELYQGPQDGQSQYDRPIGIGHSVRRKGERRNHRLGTSLAAARAFADASVKMFEVAEVAEGK